ncbi:MAG: hypothetical protein OEY51_06690 [Cyclobacteriaceae bacterium]|nr:hypothetical protein [Cyclobacteriaceae bacterium]
MHNVQIVEKYAVCVLVFVSKVDIDVTMLFYNDVVEGQILLLVNGRQLRESAVFYLKVFIKQQVIEIGGGYRPV